MNLSTNIASLISSTLIAADIATSLEDASFDVDAFVSDDETDATALLYTGDLEVQ